MHDEQTIGFRDAVEADLPAIINLLADDFLGGGREAAGADDMAAYRTAFGAIEASPDNRLIVACRGERVVGNFQLTFIPGLSFTGGKRAQIEAVRVDSGERGNGIGGQMIQYGIAAARLEKCCLVQLAMNKQRTDTLRFYKRLGFEASHEGFKLML